MTLATLEPAALSGRPALYDLLCCPTCRGDVDVADDAVRCRSAACGQVYPVLGGVPILICEPRSLFTIQGFLDRRPTFFKPLPAWRARLSRLLPNEDLNVAARENFERLRRLLHERYERARVLVVGGSIVGAGMQGLVDDPRIELIETDAAWGPRTQLICDGHDLPLKDGSVDCVIVQAVLEHVLDPRRVVAEVHRVLSDRGLVYSDTPFMVPVHGREFDFTRFTYLGHRRLLREFRELASGITCGPGMALAYAVRYFVLSFFTSRGARAVASGVTRCLTFWLKYFDYWLARRPAAYDAALAFYFLGEKSDSPLDDHALVAGYRGGF